MLLQQAALNDIEKLAEYNQCLIQDEASGNTASLLELQNRMKGFLENGYKAYLILEEVTGIELGYILADFSSEPVFIRHFFIRREYRRKGLGQAAFLQFLDKEQILGAKLQILKWNQPALAFFAQMGFEKAGLRETPEDGKHLWFSLNPWVAFIPEFILVRELSLRNRIIDTFEEAKRISGWSFQGLRELPFTVNIPGIKITLREHMRNVAYTVDKNYDIFRHCYGIQHPEYTWDYTKLIAGALLHDVGKIIEYSADENGRPYINERGKLMHHSISGAMLAEKHGISEDIVHIIAVHVQDGMQKFRSPEAAIVNKIDLFHFDPFKSFIGMKQNY
ncbi:MAG: GNAT family N-acetyltransferase [Lachnospiraceae bacterium]|nr:GNAT family N-acetyltransferase [Lachnospiraceae bacterium]